MNAQPSSDHDDLVDVGYITGAYGIQGMVKIRCYSEEPVLLQVKQWFLQKKDLQDRALEPAYTVQVKSVRIHNEFLVAKLTTCQDRNQAESLKGSHVLLARKDFPEPAEDEFYWVDLEGCHVYRKQDDEQSPTFFGTVLQVSENAVHGILHIERQTLVDGTPQALLSSKGRPQISLVPFVKAHVIDVDLEAKRLVIDWPADF
ncbi:ribosome maturation factor RimM [Brackiella oedipodis]|uniref:ribosome maturation factor RimM n=1 Tax=Brackiella oedipodis TaxID=124225 RepID=UPI00048CCF4B|nr:ribosome maturation factor RimM [Brackiella oedipodis]